MQKKIKTNVLLLEGLIMLEIIIGCAAELYFLYKDFLILDSLNCVVFQPIHSY